MTKQDELVSVIIPVYNAAQFVAEAIYSVLEQTYQNWELLLIDDGSTDDSVKIIREFQTKDRRIALLENGEVNSGAAATRNRGLDQARGRFIAFLDADDLWDKTKLRKQVDFMIESGVGFSYTSYEFADATGKPNGVKVSVPERVSYRTLITNVTISTITVMFDTQKVPKDLIYMPDVRIGHDAATWWKVLKTIDYAYGLKDVLSYYRRTPHTLSANKLKAVLGTWNLYRNVEGFGLIRSFWYLARHSYNALRRRIR